MASGGADGATVGEVGGVVAGEGFKVADACTAVVGIASDTAGGHRTL